MVTNTGETPALNSDAPVEKALRRPRGQVLSSKMKLDAPQREGFVRRFVVNTPARVMEMERMGYQLATEKAGEGISRTHGVGTRIERMGGTTDKGEPMGMILMETPKEEYALGLKDKEDALKPFEAALRAGKDTQGRLTENTYDAGSKLSDKPL